MTITTGFIAVCELIPVMFCEQVARTARLMMHQIRIACFRQHDPPLGPLRPTSSIDQAALLGLLRTGRTWAAGFSCSSSSVACTRG